MIKAVLFDLDETLHDRTGSLREFLKDQHARWPGLGALPLDAFSAAFVERDRRGRVDKGQVYRELLEAFGLPGDGEAERLSDDYYRKYRRFARGSDGLDELLSGLRKRGLRTGIITNGRTGFQTGVIRALGLDGKVDTILVSEAEDLRKPDPEIFRRAARRLATDIAECMFVGDDPVADVLGARAAGMLDVWFANGAEWPSETEKGPDLTVGSLTDVLKLVEDLRSG